MAGALLIAMVAVAGACTGVKSSLNRPRVLIVGDSIAAELSPYLSLQLIARGKEVRSVAVGGCAVIRGIPSEENPPGYGYNNTICEGVPPGHVQVLNEYKPNTVVWFSIIETYPRVVDGVIYDPCCPANPAVDQKLNELTEEAYQRLTSTGARLIIVTVPPATTNPPPLRPEMDTRIALLNDRLRQFAASHPDVGFLDLAAMACPGGIPCSPYVGNIFLREGDNTHFSDDGAAWAADIIAPFVYP